MSSAEPGRHMAGWLLLATAGFSVSAVADNPLTSVAATLVGILGVTCALIRRPIREVDPVVMAGFLGLVVLAVSGPERMARFSVVNGTHGTWLALSTLTCLLALIPRLAMGRRIVAMLALSVMAAGSVLVLVPDWEPELSSDIHRAHLAGGEALARGENPYSDAVVFASGDPNKPESTLVEGYPYPLPALATYGIASMATDPRIVSAVSWGLVGVGLAYLALRRHRPSPFALAVLVLLAVTPIWRMALFMSWTEPLTIALFGAGMIGIARGRAWGWIALGVALASKQYLVMLTPLLFAIPGWRGRSKGALALGVAAVVAALPAVLGPAEYLQSVVGNALDIGFRPDTQSLNGAIASVGVDFLIPVWALLPVLVVLVAWIWRLKLPARMIPSAGVLTLSVGLLVTSAFPNYWLLVTSLAGFAALAAATDDEDRRSDPAEEPRRDVDVPTGGHQVAKDPVPGEH